MYYLLFPLFLVLIYSATSLSPKSAPPAEVEAPQTKPADNPPTSQPAIVKEMSPLMAPSQYAERKGDAPKEGKVVDQGWESDIVTATSGPAATGIATTPLYAGSAGTAPNAPSATGEERFPMIPPSEYVEKKEDVKEAASKQEKWTAQGQESEFEMVAPSEPVEKKEEVKEGTPEIAQQNNPAEEKQDTNIAMAAPSEPVINEAAASGTQAKPKEEPADKKQATEEKSPMMAPSEPNEAVKEGIREYPNIAMAAPSEAGGNKESAESSEAKPEVKSEVAVEAKAIEETPPQNKAEEIPHEKTGVVPVLEDKVQPLAAATVEKPEPEEKTEPSKEEELRITAVNVKKLGKLTRAEIVTSGELLHYNIFSLDAPYRVVVDVKGATEISVKMRIKVVSPNIKNVRLGQHDKFARVVFDYKEKAQPYEVIKDKDRIIIFFGKKLELKPDPEKKLTATERAR